MKQYFKLPHGHFKVGHYKINKKHALLMLMVLAVVAFFVLSMKKCKYELVTDSTATLAKFEDSAELVKALNKCCYKKHDGDIAQANSDTDVPVYAKYNKHDKKWEESTDTTAKWFVVEKEHKWW